MHRTLLMFCLLFNPHASQALGFGGFCKALINRVFFYDDHQLAQRTLKEAFGDGFAQTLASRTEFRLRYLLPNPQAWEMVEPSIRNATHLDLSKNPKVSARVLYRLLENNAGTIKLLDLRGVPVSSRIFDLIANRMPVLERLRLDSVPWFSLFKLGGHPKLIELDIRKATPFWFEVKNFIRNHPPKLRSLKVRNHPDALFVERLRQMAHQLKQTLEVHSLIHQAYAIENFINEPNFDHVLDGDTITASLQDLGGAMGASVSIRVRDLNAPELKSDDQFEAKMAIAARVFLFRLLAGHQVVIDNVEADRYRKRYVADVFVDGESVYHAMTRNRLAVYYPYEMGQTKRPITDWKAIYLGRQAFYDQLIDQAAGLE